MRRIFTFAAFAGFMAISLNSIAQCTFSTTAPTGAPGIQNQFTSNAEGFSGNVSYTGGDLTTTNTNGTVTITSPVYFVAPGVTSVILRFTLDRLASNDISAYRITATTNTGTVQLCPTTAISISPNAPTTYYITAPIGFNSVNFRYNIILTQNGSFRFDNFGTTATGTNGTLPVHFVSFDAKSSSNGVNLSWNVEAEENLSGYNVERSTDGRSFAQIGFVDAAGQHSYNFVDTRANSGNSFYRIKSVDVDGKYMYSTTVSIKGGKSSTILRAFPSVIQSDVTIQHETAAKGSQISIAAEDGKTVKSVVPTIGTQQTVVNLSSVRPGLYIVRYTNASGEAETLKIVKQ